MNDKFQRVVDFVTAAGDDALRRWADSKVVALKDGGRDVATDLDQKIEREFYDLCGEYFAEHGFKGEEFPELVRDGVSGYTWHIDPIDGTKYFASEIPLWSVTVSLVKDIEPLFGVIYNPVSKQLYWAEKGKGAYLNGKRLAIRADTEPKAMQLAVDFFMHQDSADKKLQQDALLSKLFDKFYRVRSLGTGSLSLAWLAQGHFGAYLSWGQTINKFSDIAAGIVIAEQAGATIHIKRLGDGTMAVIVGGKKTANYLLAMIAEL